MRSIIGLALLMTGLTIGTYAFFPETAEQHVSLANVTRVIAPVVEQAAHAAQPIRLGANTTPHASTHSKKLRAAEVRNFSPGARLITAARTNNEPVLKSKPRSARQKRITTASIGNTDTAKLVKTPIIARRNGWATVVTPSVPHKSGSSPLKSSLPADGSAKYALVRDIQRELKRVGCYWGKIDGDWGPGSKRAINGFIHTVNAALPTKDPDYILLALIRSQQDQVCGTSKPTTTIIASRSTGTRLKSQHALERTPRLIATPRLARRAPTQLAEAPTPSVKTLRRVASRQPLEGRMSIGGPKPHTVSATQTAPGVSSLPATTSATVKRTSATPRKAKPRKRVRVATSRPKRKKHRRRYRRRGRSSPLSNLLRQGVH